jgi:hypothetical protein
LVVTRVWKRRGAENDDNEELHSAIIRILKGSLDWQRFPTFCAILIGGSTILQVPLQRLFARFAKSLSVIARDRLARWIAGFIAAWYGMRVLQQKTSEAFIERVPPNTYSATGELLRDRHFAGRTMDLTLFAVIRALDVIVGELWSWRRTTRTSSGTWTKRDDRISSLTDPALFAASSALIMWCWTYLPERLPRAYNKWITSAAQVDFRLIKALRLFQWGQLQYGRDTGQSELITGMCRDYGMPLEWGDPTKSIPFPCEIVHMGTGANCEKHAVRRFFKGFGTALSMYGSINLVLQLRSPSVKGARRAVLTSLRSSAFLGAFIALFYYGVCLARCRVGPRILGTDVKAAQRIDSGICMGTGCALCGWSILLENEGRRKDIALFVAPRALATVLPRRYEKKHQWRETLAFALSAAVVMTCAQENPARIRGVFGRVLGRVLR